MFTGTHSKTHEVLASMLTENTGRSLLDSGDYYGRHYETNAGMTVDDFLAQPRIAVDKWQVWLSVFHYLAERLTFHEPTDLEFQELCEVRQDDGWLPLMEEFATFRDSRARTWNTYNGDDSLSQTIQGVTFTHYDEVYVLLQIHGGCDVRGGYTRPRAFRVTMSDGEMFPFDNDTFHISCNSGDETHSLSYYGSWTTWEGSSADTDEYPEYTDEGLKCTKCGSLMTPHAPEPY